MDRYERYGRPVPAYFRHESIGHNYMKVHVRTSSCQNAGTNARLDFWFCDGEIGRGRVHFNTRSEPLGPFTIGGHDGDKLERGQGDLVSTNSAGGHLYSISENMKLLIIKKADTGFFDSFADAWKPESVEVFWRDRFGNNFDKTFGFPYDCNKGWIASNDFYVADHLGHLYRMVGTENLGITDVVNHRVPGDIEIA